MQIAKLDFREFDEFVEIVEIVEIKNSPVSPGKFLTRSNDAVRQLKNSLIERHRSIPVKNFPGETGEFLNLTKSSNSSIRELTISTNQTISSNLRILPFPRENSQLISNGTIRSQLGIFRENGRFRKSAISSKSSNSRKSIFAICIHVLRNVLSQQLINKQQNLSYEILYKISRRTFFIKLLEAHPTLCF